MLQQTKIGFKTCTRTVSRLIYINGIKWYAKNKAELERTIPIVLVRVFSKDINMHFVIKKCGQIHIEEGNSKQ